MVARYIFKKSIVIVLLCLIPFTICSCEAGSQTVLSTNDLNERYGQANRTYNDGISCYRDCDGTPKNCYFKFMVETYDTMSKLCGDCVNGILSDCFNPGCVTANGVERNIMTVNRELPGTPINVCKDDRVIIDVTNHLPGAELSIHWHGVYQTETPWMDGVPMVTQCPIPSGTTFRYDFHVRESGTHYYHAHSGVHRTNGLTGTMNVRQPDDTNAEFYDYDRAEHSILLADWYNFLAEDFSPGIQSRPLQPDSILINGRGSFNNSEFGNFTYAPLEVFYVERGKRHLFRIDNAASHNCPFEFSIEDHKLTVTATDGYPIRPVTVDRVVSQAGERYDVVIDAINDANIKQKLIRVRALGTCATLQLQEFARIVFVNNLDKYFVREANQEPLNTRPSYNSLDDPTAAYLNHPQTDCTDKTSNSLCVAALQQKDISSPTGGNLRFENIANGFPFEFRNIIGQERPSVYLTAGNVTMVSTINNISSVHPPFSILTQDDSSLKYCNADNLPSNCEPGKVCYCTHLTKLELCKVYEFFLYDLAGQPGGPISHPIHLHGYGFQVVDMGTLNQYKSRTTAFADSQYLPPVKDTVSIPSGGFVRLRFKSCNPGYWYFHCHFEFHMHTGMMAIFKVGEREDMVPPPPNFPTCGNFMPSVDTCTV
ncbi:laccase-like [Contarinia nasturtii]|uniref:laccase-like n=1 Tax=Contarinia nasturtii TaxID=265458 RepID=UPI0012D3D83E|nr:laccase-like [Contarinia nasturtii]